MCVRCSMYNKYVKSNIADFIENHVKRINLSNDSENMYINPSLSYNSQCIRYAPFFFFIREENVKGTKKYSVNDVKRKLSIGHTSFVCHKTIFYFFIFLFIEILQTSRL